MKILLVVFTTLAVVTVLSFAAGNRATTAKDPGAYLSILITK